MEKTHGSRSPRWLGHRRMVFDRDCHDRFTKLGKFSLERKNILLLKIIVRT